MSLLCGACDQGKLASLEGRLAKAEEELDTLRQEYDDYRSSRAWREMLEESRAVAYLTPGSEGYSVIQSDLGLLTVSLADVRPYANGSRVTLQFGNLTSATISGMKANVEWGAVDERGLPAGDQKSREVKISKSLRGGAWTKTSVVLEGTQPAELGFVRVRDLTHSSINLLVN